MRRIGTHLIVEGRSTAQCALDDPECSRRALEAAVEAGGMTLLALRVHRFVPHGVTAFALLAESHIAIHTWPELGYFAADLFFCGTGDPQRALAALSRGLQARDVRVCTLERGFDESRSGDNTGPARDDAPPAPGWWYEKGRPATIVQALRARRLHLETTPYQRLEVLAHESLGRVLVLDGAVQASSADEFVYHEMLVHVPLLGRRAPQGRAAPASVLIIGGGDGGALREVLRHDWVRRVVMVELDEAVVRRSAEWLGIHGDYADPRVELLFGDGAEYLRSRDASEAPFDVAIVDSTDPGGPADALYDRAFYAALRRQLSAGGAMCQQMGLPAYDGDALDGRARRVHDVFGRVQVYRAAVPTYVGGDLAFALATRDGHGCEQPQIAFTGRHYNPAVHAAAFALPTWWRETLGG